MFCELERSTVNREHAEIIIAELVVWWFQAGRVYYSRRASQADEGLRLFVVSAVEALGGWKAARRTLASAGM
jgi:hypothetical protein